MDTLHISTLFPDGSHVDTTCWCVAGGAGVRESRHLPAGEAAGGGRQGPGPLLHHALHRHLQEGRPQDRQLRCSAPGGENMK